MKERVKRKNGEHILSFNSSSFSGVAFYMWKQTLLLEQRFIIIDANILRMCVCLLCKTELETVFRGLIFW